MRDHGSIEIALRIHLDATVNVSRDAVGRVHVRVDACDCDITHVDARFHDGWLYNLFDGVIEKSIKRILEAQLCEEIQVHEQSRESDSDIN